MAEDWAEGLREVGYINNVTHTLRQDPGVLYPLAKYGGNYAGKTEVKVEDRFGRLRMRPKTTRNGDTNIQDPSVERVWLKKPGRYNLATLIDRDDIDSTSVELKSPLIEETSDAARTYHDDRMVLGFWSGVWTGAETAETLNAFPSGNKVAAGFGNGGTPIGITKKKLIEMRRLLGINNVKIQREQPIILLDPGAASEMLAIEEYINHDYTDARVLETGELKPWLGFRFMEANLGSAADYPDSYTMFNVGGVNRLPVIVPANMHRGVWVEFWGKVSDRADKQHSEQIYAEAESAVTRTDDAKTWFMEVAPVS